MRWWDGVGWTEHLALPEPEPELEAPANPYLVPREHQEDDGQLHRRARDVAFSGAPRGSVQPLAQRRRITRDSITSARGLQVGGAAAFSFMCWYLAITGVLHGGGGVIAGLAAGLGALVPLVTRSIIHVQLRAEFWDDWCLSRGFEPRTARAESLLPANPNRSPLIGPLESRHVELAGRRQLCRRDAVVGCLLRILPPGDDLDPLATPTYHRATFVVMPLPEAPAARWAGVSIRADHHARRPLLHRAMLGTLVPIGVADARAHVAAVAEQDPHLLQHLVDARLEQYLHDHPMDVDVVGDLLVVTRDGAPDDADVLDDLCRDALLLHELLVAEHELPRHLEVVAAVAMPEEQPVVDLTREGWGEQMQELHGWDEGEQQLAA